MTILYLNGEVIEAREGNRCRVLTLKNQEGRKGDLTIPNHANISVTLIKKDQNWRVTIDFTQMSKSGLVYVSAWCSEVLRVVAKFGLSPEERQRLTDDLQ